MSHSRGGTRETVESQEELDIASSLSIHLQFDRKIEREKLVQICESIQINVSMNQNESLVYAHIEENNELTICSDKHVVHFCPPAFEQKTLISGGPYIFSTAFNGLIGAIANSDTPPYTNSFLLIFQQGTGIFLKNLEFVKPITGLQSTTLHVFVSMDLIIQVLDAKTDQIISTINRQFPNGLFSATCKYFVWPDEAHRGELFIATVPEFSVLNKIKCHSGSLQNLAISQENKVVLTCSSKGTLIRVFDLENGKKIGEHRRGFKPGTILSMDSRGGLICACTATTIHVFTISGGHLTIQPPGIPLNCKFDPNMLSVVTQNGLLSIYQLDLVNMTAEMKSQSRLLSGIIPKRRTRRTTI